MNNVNVVSRIETNNVNDNVERTEAQVNSLASHIMRKLKTTENWPYYCKVSWKLSESKINNNLEIALKSNRSPQRYFTWLCNRDMEKRNGY